MKLLNVRLDAQDARKAEELRRAGVLISRLVRDAIRAEHGKRYGPARRRSAASVMAEIYAACPDPPGLAPRDYDVAGRRAARRAVQRRLRKKRT